MTPDQYRRAPIPAYGRTIEAMRLALLDTPAGRSMINAGDTRLYWMNESDAYMLMSPFGIESPFINTNAPDAVARLVKLADQLDQNATNAERMVALLQPEFDAFLARSGHNVYVVRDYVDHQSAAKRQRQEALDIRAALAAMEASHDRT